MSENSPHLIWSGPQFTPDSRAAKTGWSKADRPHGDRRVRLLGALRGSGLLVWAEGYVAVTYELDIYRRGDACSASGALEGDFAALLRTAQGQEADSCAARLKIEGDCEVEVELFGLEACAAEFDVSTPLTSDGAPFLDSKR